MDIVLLFDYFCADSLGVYLTAVFLSLHGNGQDSIATVHLSSTVDNNISYNYTIVICLPGCQDRIHLSHGSPLRTPGSLAQWGHFLTSL